MSSNQTASTVTTNIVPVQGLFDADGNCISLIGPGGEYFSPPVTFGDVTNQPHIEVYDLSSSITVNATPTFSYVSHCRFCEL